MATLFINRSDSRCGACGKGADPSEWRHESRLGYGPRGVGCMEMFTALASDYTGMKDAVTGMRPDLRWEGFE